MHPIINKNPAAVVIIARYTPYREKKQVIHLLKKGGGGNPQTTSLCGGGIRYSISSAPSQTNQSVLALAQTKRGSSSNPQNRKKAAIAVPTIQKNREETYERVMKIK